MGLRLRWLGTEQLTWHDLYVIVRQSPLGSALNRARGKEAAQFGVQERLQVATLNTLRGMSWQLGGDPKAARPEPFEIPGEGKSKQLGDSMTIEEMDARLAQYR